MIKRRIWYTDAGVLRAPWRLFLFLLAAWIAMVASVAIVGPAVTLVFDAVGLRGMTTAYIVQAVGLIAATWFMVRVIDKRPWSYVWLGPEALRARLLAIGFAIGCAAIAVPILALIGVHWLREQPGNAGSWWGAAIRVSIFLFPAALLEELLTRGYILSVLRDTWGWTAAIVATSVGFGLLHLWNPEGVSAESIGLVTFAGIFLAGVVYATRSLYAAWLAHFAWNWTMAVVFHTAVSGLPMEAPRYRYVDAGPDWATGGEWGPEGGLPAGLGMAAGIVYLFARRKDEPRAAES
ncbi:MAG TPA: type II CAAX endopeptidase family protein [Gemmatimonadaceae bacterium]|nr:type II CAAX endopeptidase family protein [Gemmatimonadaceae bacterium]